MLQRDAEYDWHRIRGHCAFICVACRVTQSYVAACCNVLQCVAVCCRVLQCVAVCCSLLQNVTLAHSYVWLVE